MIEFWGAAVGIGAVAGSIAGAAVIGGVASVAGGAISANAQASSATTAAQAQVDAAQLQENTEASAANAELGIQAPTRELGGLAQQQLAYELGLSPNLDISTDFSTPQVSANGTTTWVPNSSLAGNNVGTTTATPTNVNTVPNVNGAGINAPSVSTGTPTRFPVQNEATGVGGTGYNTGIQGTNPGVATPVTAAPTSTAVSGTAPVQTGSTGPNTGEGGYGSLVENPFQNPANLTLSPAYQFDLSAGESAINNQEAAAGNSPVSTGTEDAEDQYAEGNALNAYSTAFNQAQSEQTMDYNELAATAGEAQIGNAGASSAIESGSSGISAAEGAAGSATAAGDVAQGNAITSGIGTALSGITGATNPYLYGTGTGLNLGGTTTATTSPYSTGFSGYAGSTGYDPVSGAFTD